MARELVKYGQGGTLKTMTYSMPRIQFAVIGDVEPKGDTSFSNLRKTVTCINQMATHGSISFTASVGDICHRGSIAQYETASELLSDLSCPFYAIMGNEELMESKERFLSYASRWNKDQSEIPDTSYVKCYAGIVFIFVTAHQGGKTFSDEEITWLEECIDAHPENPIMIFTHAPMPGLFPEAKGRTMEDDKFNAILRRQNVHIVFSGHTHFDLDTVNSAVKDTYGVYHIHIPGIERTKVGPTHTPRFRIVGQLRRQRIGPNL